jgi:hypothetical protein
MEKRLQRKKEEIPEAVVLHLNETEISSVVAAGGGRYVGVLKEIPGKMEPIILFISPRTRTTLGLPISNLTVDAVREHLAESDAVFAGAGAK